MNISRRAFVSTCTAMGGTLLLPGFGLSAEASAVRVGACVVGLEDAKKAGLDGVEVEVGRNGDNLAVADPAVRAKYKEQMQSTGLPIRSLMMGQLNQFPLASDPRTPQWMEQAIDAAKDLGVKVILVAFFGNGDLLDKEGKLKEKDVEVVVQRIKACAGRAKDAGVVLGIENYLNADQNLRILEQVNHEAVQVYYDVFNTGATKGHDAPGDIRRLKGRICQVHFKNGPKFLEEGGKVDFGACVKALKEINYAGWIVLETSSPTKNRVADAKKNAEYVRKLLGA